MYCENCGKQLIRGYSFCVECGSPVPPEVLEEGGLPGRTGEASEETPKQAETEKAASEENGGDVLASMPGIDPLGSGKDEGTLVFCANCGMRMQHNLDFCEKCGMKISDKPSHSVPLINNTPMGLDGSFDAFGGGVGGFADGDLNQLNDFLGGDMPSAFENAEETDSLFGSNSFSANDMAILNQQISSFGASSSEMPAISKSGGFAKQQEPKGSETRKVENFSMSDVSDEVIPVSDGGVPVIEGCSMDEDHSKDISLDPYTFLGNSMEEPDVSSIESVNIEEPEPVAVEPEPVAVEPEPVAVEEIENEVEPMAEEPAKDTADPDFDDFIPEEMGFIAETVPVQETEKAAVATASPVEDMDFSRPRRPQNNAPQANPDEETPKGNLVYCRTCGQDMYDSEKFCKNCGATYKGAYVPPKSAPSKSASKPPVMVFGKIPLSKFTGVLAGIVGVAAAVIFLVQPWRQNTSKPPISEGNQSTSSSVSTPVESSSSSSSSSPSVSSSSSSSSETTSASSSSSSSSSQSSTSTKSSSTKSSSTKTSSSSSSKPVVTADTKLKSLEQDREKIMYAAELIAGEVGKMEALSQHVVYAMNTSTSSNEEAITTFYSSKLATNMINNLKTGKSTVERAISAASPKNSEFSSLYTALKSLKSKYDSYYNFITSPKGGYSAFTKNCQSYYAMFTSAMSGLNLSKFTTSYTAAYKNSAYASMISQAVSAAKNSTAQISLLQSKLSSLDSFERKAFNTLSNDISTYVSAVSYAMRAKAYTMMLNNVSSDYSSATKYVSSAYDELNSFLKVCTSLPKTTASAFNEKASKAISLANSYSNAALRIIS